VLKYSIRRSANDNKLRRRLDIVDKMMFSAMRLKDGLLVCRKVSIIIQVIYYIYIYIYIYIYLTCSYLGASASLKTQNSL